MERAAFILILPGPITISKALRIAGSTILNIVTATLGTAILESAVYNVYHPETLSGLYKKELLLSGTVAFSLGALVYSKWKCRSAEWICILGFAGFIWRILLGDQPPTLYAETQWVTLVVVSLRLITYSAGALAARSW